MVCFLVAFLMAGVFSYMSFWRRIWQEFHEDRLRSGDETRYRFFSVKGRVAHMYWWLGMGTYSEAAYRRNNNQMRWFVSGLGTIGVFFVTISICDGFQ